MLGGVPNLPEDFPVRNRDFVGCMRKLSIDSKPVDMEGYIANNGTAPGQPRRRGGGGVAPSKSVLTFSPSIVLFQGCPAKRNFCAERRCQNGGACVSGWDTYSCGCPTGYGGKSCEQGNTRLSGWGPNTRRPRSGKRRFEERSGTRGRLSLTRRESPRGLRSPNLASGVEIQDVSKL